MKFLFRRTTTEKTRRVLVIQTSNPNLLDYVLRDVRERFPEAEVVVLLQRNMRTHIRLRRDMEYIDNPSGGKREFARRIKAERYDLMVVTTSGESGYWKLKLLPFFSDPGRVLAYNRMAEARDLNVFKAGRYLADVLGSLAGLGGGGLPEGRNLLRKLLAPAIFAYLALYYWYRNSHRRK